jgi:hypothetical protein
VLPADGTLALQVAMHVPSAREEQYMNFQGM